MMNARKLKAEAAAAAAASSTPPPSARATASAVTRASAAMANVDLGKKDNDVGEEGSQNKVKEGEEESPQVGLLVPILPYYKRYTGLINGYF